MDELSLIKRRLAEIAEEMAAIDDRRDELREEEDELEIAERVLARLSGIVAAHDQEQKRRTATLRNHGVKDRGKPHGTASVPDMIVRALEMVCKDGLRGVEPKAIRQVIAEHWWPDVRNETVNSIAWRMWKRGQLEKDGPVYMLPKRNEAAGTPSKSAPTASAQEHPKGGMVG